MESRITRHEPLYLKYRPQSLGELVGQEAVTRTLTNAITYGRLTHAYLFTGPRGTGKTSSARILAKSLNCESSQGATVTPCQQCGPCKEITSGISPAVMEIDAASNNSVDDARLLIERAPLKAVGGRNKIYIIDECHMLTKEAFNALLKTIEQPPPDVVFILATTEEHKVLPTIISRCQRLMFRNVEQNALSAHLRNVASKESIEIEDEALRVIARRSGGGLRDALSTLDQASLLGAPGRPVSVNDLLRLMGALHEDILVSLSEKILMRDGHGLLQSMAALLAEGREPSVLAREIAAHFLNLAKSAYLAKGPDATVEALRSVVLGSDQYLGQLLQQAPKFENAELTQIIEALDRLETTCRRTTQPTMHLEMGLLSVCHRHDMLLIRELSDRVSRLESMLQDGGELVARKTDSSGALRPASDRPARSLPVQSVVASGASSSSSSSSRGAGNAAAGNPSSGGIASGGSTNLSGHSADAGSSAPTSSGSTGSGYGGNAAYSRDSNQNHSDHGSTVSSSVPGDEPGTPANRPASIPSVGSDIPVAQRVDDRENVPSRSVSSVEGPIHTNQGSGDRSRAVLPADCDAAQFAEQDSAAQPPGTDIGSGGEGVIHDVEFVWSRILDELHRINIPTHGFFNSKVAFLLELNSEEMVFGVKTPNFQKTLEQKTNHLKSACKAVIGKELNVRVKISAGEVKPVVAASAATRRPGAASPPASSPVNSVSTEGSAAVQQSSVAVQNPPEGVVSSSNETKAEFDNGAVKEAYKLFEGPGSRRIQ